MIFLIIVAAMIAYAIYEMPTKQQAFEVVYEFEKVGAHNCARVVRGFFYATWAVTFIGSVGLLYLAWRMW